MEAKRPDKTELNRIPLYVIIVILGFFLGTLVKQCNSTDFTSVPNLHTHSSDTVTVDVPGPVIHDTTKIPYPVYIAAVKKNISVAELNAYLDSIRFYSDTIRIDSASYIVAQDSVLGKKTWSQYIRNIKPYSKLVTVTNTDSTTNSTTITVQVPSWKSGLFLQGEVGGNESSFNYSVGASFISKKKWSAGYRYGINQRTHNLSLGIKIL